MFSNYFYITCILILFSNRSVMCILKPKIECGYKQCPQTRDGALNVHLIPHSHMDAGWVKTFDEYSYGTHTSISTANVQLIFHSVISELLHDKERKFTFAESAYFWRWWKEQRLQTRATFRGLVQEGRIEFAGGGWIQNDEAVPDYLDIIDQFTWGLRKINDTLGPCGKPKAAWQIDTYGHTREQVSLLAQMGYDGLFIGRVDYKEREAMIEEDRMEFMWRGSDVLGKMTDIMTHTLYNLYNAPDGFCFDPLCNDEPIIDDPDIRVHNAGKRVSEFIAQIERQAKYYDHDNIMVTMGGDFTYQSAANWFMNMDKLINYVNSHPANMSDVNIFYSTPSCYLKAVYLYGRRDKNVYTERADHLPYGSDAQTYWTGYYSSRPSLKYLVRRASVFLQIVKQLTVISKMGDSYELHLLRHAVALVLHHDAVTGTSQQHVTNDYIKTLTEAMNACTKKASNLLSYLTPSWGGSRRTKTSQMFTVCHQLNASTCRFVETQDSMLLLVYNPQSVKTYHYVRLPAIALQYTIRDANDEEVEYQLTPLMSAAVNLPGRTASRAIQEVVFEAENIPPLGFAAYYIASIRDQLEENEFAKKSHHMEFEQDTTPYITNEYLRVSVNKETGLLESIQHVDGVKIEVSQNFHFYNQQNLTQYSGAYTFRTAKDRPIQVTEKAIFHTIKGSLVKEIHQKFSDWVSQVIRLYRGEEFVELEWLIGPVPVSMDRGKEVVTLFITNITNNGEFFTDSNGRQMMKRSCLSDSHDSKQKRSVPACYFPVSSRICIHSPNVSVEMCVLPDRTQGGTSYNEGEVELMVHRRLLTDDGFGLEENLNEEAFGTGLVVKGKHRILFGNYRQELDGLSFSERVSHAARRWMMDPWLFMTSGDKLSRRKWQNIRNKRVNLQSFLFEDDYDWRNQLHVDFTALRLRGLPRHVRIVTLEPWKAGSVLLRLENTLEKRTRRDSTREKTPYNTEIPRRSSVIAVNLRKLFQHLVIKSIRETTLAANQWLDSARQMDWSTRYVYNDADDSVLREDNVDYNDDEVGNSAQESEESYIFRKRNKNDNDKVDKSSKKSPRHASYETVEKKKRSVDVFENLIESNKTYYDNVSNENEETTVSRCESLMRTISPTVKAKRVHNKPTHIMNDDLIVNDDVLIDAAANNISKRMIYVTATRKTPRNTIVKQLNNAGRGKRPFRTEIKKSSDEILDSSEEDISYNVKRRSRRRSERKNLKAIEVNLEQTDDGVTKSVYEMYYKKFKVTPNKKKYSYTYFDEQEQRKKYKTSTLRNPHKYEEEDSGSVEMNEKSRRREFREMYLPTRERVDREFKDKGAVLNVRSIEEDIMRNTRFAVRSTKKTQRQTKDTQRNTQKRRTNKRRYEDDYETEPTDGYYEDEREYGPRAYSRKKRNAKTPEEVAHTDPSNLEIVDQTETEFMINLRPTQIRTFVIWFEPSVTASRQI